MLLLLLLLPPPVLVCCLVISVTAAAAAAGLLIIRFPQPQVPAAPLPLLDPLKVNKGRPATHSQAGSQVAASNGQPEVTRLQLLLLALPGRPTALRLLVRLGISTCRLLLLQELHGHTQWEPGNIGSKVEGQRLLLLLLLASAAIALLLLCCVPLAATSPPPAAAAGGVLLLLLLALLQQCRPLPEHSILLQVLQV